MFCLNPLLVKSFECLSKNWRQHAGFINWGKTVWQKLSASAALRKIKSQGTKGYFYFYFRYSRLACFIFVSFSFSAVRNLISTFHGKEHSSFILWPSLWFYFCTNVFRNPVSGEALPCFGVVSKPKKKFQKTQSSYWFWCVIETKRTRSNESSF